MLCPEVSDTAVIEGHCMSLGYVFLFYQSMLKVLVEMERNGIIKEDDLAMLKDILKGVRADIKKKIDTYEEKKKGKLFNLLFESRAGVFVIFVAPSLAA